MHACAACHVELRWQVIQSNFINFVFEVGTIVVLLHVIYMSSRSFRTVRCIFVFIRVAIFYFKIVQISFSFIRFVMAVRVW